MMYRRGGAALACTLMMVVAGCGSDGSVDTTAATEATTEDGAADDQESPETEETASPETTAAPEQDTPDAPTQDASAIDWATVDLTTIDWATIDMAQVDLDAAAENPTAENLDEDTVALIQSRMEPFDPGSATLTIGDQTWEFDSFVCAFGHEATSSDVYSFSSDSRGEHEGAAVQMQANIRDDSGEGRYEGDGLTHDVFITDISDFENPSIDLQFFGPSGIVIDGNTVTAEGLFDDELTDEIEEIPGTLEATCGTASRR